MRLGRKAENEEPKERILSREKGIP